MKQKLKKTKKNWGNLMWTFGYTCWRKHLHGYHGKFAIYKCNSWSRCWSIDCLVCWSINILQLIRMHQRVMIVQWKKVPGWIIVKRGFRSLYVGCPMSCIFTLSLGFFVVSVSHRGQSHCNVFRLNISTCMHKFY